MLRRIERFFVNEYLCLKHCGKNDTNTKYRILNMVEIVYKFPTKYNRLRG